MGKSPKEILSEEYSKRMNSVFLWPLKFAGYLRFETKNSHFIAKLPSTIIRSIIMIILVNISGAYILFVTAYKDKYLTVTEMITIIFITSIQNATLINVTFPNRNSGLKLINTCIEIDTVLGYRETKFIRNITFLTFVFLSFFIGFFQFIVSVVLFAAHSVSDSVHVVGTFYFAMAFLIFFDACFLAAFHNFLSLRVHYVNIALMKLAKINSTYFANQLFFNGILWNTAFDKFITFHNRTEATQFIQAFSIIFAQLRQLEKCFRFTIFVSLTSLIIGTFIGVQTIFLHIQLPDVNILRTIAVIGWVGLGWIYLLSLTQHLDMFSRQIEKTKLICNYIQLKPVMCANVLKLTKDLLRMLEVHEPRLCIYSMYHFDTSLILQVAASIFVYITVQLQLTAPTNRPHEILANITEDSNEKTLLYH